jgi:hypothetical protein
MFGNVDIKLIDTYRNLKGRSMNSDAFKNQCDDITKEYQIKIPCLLAERVESYAKKYDTTIAGVVIEALDMFLRGRKDRIG